MAIKYLARGDSPTVPRVQTDNAGEAVFKKEGVKNWLRLCGPTAAVMLVDAVGGSPDIVTPGGWKPQPEDVLFDYFNDPRNGPALNALRKEIDPSVWYGNEIPQFYPLAVRETFGVACRFAWGATPEVIRHLIGQNIGVMVTLKDPGHFIAVVGFDEETGDFIYHDPWPGNYWPARLKGTPAAFRRVTAEELAGNVKPFRVEIG